MGVANGFMWSPLGATATRNLPITQAGAGAGVYNTTRQVGAVLGSAGIAALMESRLAHNLPALPAGSGVPQTTGALPEFLQAGFTTSMAQAILLPAAVLVIGLIAAAFFARPEGLGKPASWNPGGAAAADGTDGPPVERGESRREPAVSGASEARPFTRGLRERNLSAESATGGAAAQRPAAARHIGLRDVAANSRVINVDRRSDQSRLARVGRAPHQRGPLWNLGDVASSIPPTCRSAPVASAVEFSHRCGPIAAGIAGVDGAARLDEHGPMPRHRLWDSVRHRWGPHRHRRARA